MCGKQSRIDGFASGAAGQHVLEAARIKPLSKPGKAGGFHWEREPITADDLQLLADAVQTVSQRLQAALSDAQARGELAMPQVHTRDEARTYLLAAERAMAEAQAELEFRRREIKALFD